MRGFKEEIHDRKLLEEGEEEEKYPTRLPSSDERQNRKRFPFARSLASTTTTLSQINLNSGNAK